MALPRVGYENQRLANIAYNSLDKVHHLRVSMPILPLNVNRAAAQAIRRKTIPWWHGISRWVVLPE